MMAALKQNDRYINGSRIKVIAGPIDSINTDDRDIPEGCVDHHVQSS